MLTWNTCFLVDWFDLSGIASLTDWFVRLDVEDLRDWLGLSGVVFVNVDDLRDWFGLSGVVFFDVFADHVQVTRVLMVLTLPLSHAWAPR